MLSLMNAAQQVSSMALPVKKLLKLLYPSLIRIDEYLLKVKDFDPLSIFQ